MKNTVLPAATSPRSSSTVELSEDPGLGPGYLSTIPRESGKLAEPAIPPTGFVAVQGPRPETVSATGMVVVAYALFWLAVFAFVYRTWRAQQALSQRIDDLSRRIPKDPETKSLT